MKNTKTVIKNTIEEVNIYFDTGEMGTIDLEDRSEKENYIQNKA